MHAALFVALCAERSSSMQAGCLDYPRSVLRPTAMRAKCSILTPCVCLRSAQQEYLMPPLGVRFKSGAPKQRRLLSQRDSQPAGARMRLPAVPGGIEDAAASRRALLVCAAAAEVSQFRQRAMCDMQMMQQRSLRQTDPDARGSMHGVPVHRKHTRQELMTSRSLPRRRRHGS